MPKEFVIIQFKCHFRFASIFAAVFLLSCLPAHALGLGAAELHSGLEQPLSVDIAIVGDQEYELVLSCFKAKVESFNGELLASPAIQFTYSAQGKSVQYLHLSTKKSMLEPALKLTVLSTCASYKLQRDYSLLLDFASTPSVTQNKVPVVTKLSRQSMANTASADADSDSVQPRPALLVVAATKNKRKTVAVSSAVTSVSVPQTPLASTSAPLKNVLRLSTDETGLNYDLKLSQELTILPGDAPVRPADPEIKQAQALFAARLRDEDPLKLAMEQIAKSQKKIQVLEQKYTAARIEAQKHAAGEPDQSASPTSGGTIIWISVLGGLLLLALSAVFLMVQRIRQQREQADWWEPPLEKKKNVEEIVDFLQSAAGDDAFDPASLASVTPESSVQEKVTASVNLPVSPVALEKVKLARNDLPSLEDTNSSTFNFFSTRSGSVNVEEISDITQEAEFWMSVNDPQRAIAILEPQGDDDSLDSPVPWLYLLDLYKLVGEQAKYDDLKGRFKGKFNANIPAFDEKVLPENVRGMEDYKHLMEKVCALWHTNQILPFLENLLVDDRAGARVGFDLPVYRDILLLIAISNELERNQSTKEIFPVAPNRPNLVAKVASPYSQSKDDKGKHQLSLHPDGESLDFDYLEFKLDVEPKA